MVGRSVSGQPGIASIPDSVLVLWLKHSVKATHTQTDMRGAPVHCANGVQQCGSSSCALTPVNPKGNTRHDTDTAGPRARDTCLGCIAGPHMSEQPWLMPNAESQETLHTAQKISTA